MAESRVSFELRNSGDNSSGLVHKFALINKNNSQTDFDTFLKEAYPLYRMHISAAIEKCELVNTFAILEVECLKKNNVNDAENEKINLQTSGVILNSQTDLHKHYHENVIAELKKRIDETSLSFERITELCIQWEDKRIIFELREHAFSQRIQRFALINNNVYIDIDHFLNDAYTLYKMEIEKVLQRFKYLKTMTVFVLEFEKKVHRSTEEQTNNSNDDDDDDDNPDESVIKETVYLSTTTFRVSSQTNLREHYYENVVCKQKQNYDETSFRGSGFYLSRIVELLVQTCVYQPLGGSSYIPTPAYIKAKRAIVNVQNRYDDECFKWSILSALCDPTPRNPHRLNHYTCMNHEINFDGIAFPTCLSEIDKFMKQNDNISVNVYYFDEKVKRICPLVLSDVVKSKHIHLLVLFKEEAEQDYGDDDTAEATTEPSTSSKVRKAIESGRVLNNMHYCWIKNLSRLVSSQLSNHNGQKHICDRCLNYFGSKTALTQHVKHCKNTCTIEMPTEINKWIYFKNHKNKLKIPFIIYADTEAYLKHLDADERNRIFSAKCSTNAYQQHNIYSVGYYFKCQYNDAYSHYATSGNNKDCIDWFITELELIAKFVGQRLAEVVPMHPLTADEQYELNNPFARCLVCGKEFDLGERRVADHCHFTGKFRGPAHSNCNLNFKESYTIPLVMHNLSGYDAHHFIKQLAVKIPGDVSIIPANSEEYISFSKVVDSSSFGIDWREKVKIKFIDSLRFLPTSLSELATLISSEKKQILYREFAKDNYSLEQIALLERKGVFPYDYVDSMERLNDESLPPIEKFYSKLNEVHIEPNEYAFALEVWDKFGLSTLGQYSELYMKTDILLLADVFENYRNETYEMYQLDPAHYFTLPGLSFDAMLKHTKASIELLTDIDMLHFVERGIRGGISQCCKRYATANNKHMKEHYNPNEKSIYLMDLDGEWSILLNIHLEFKLIFSSFILITLANSLYAHALTHPLPISDYEWVDDRLGIKGNFMMSHLYSRLDSIMALPDDGENGFIFEVDLEYPQNLHDSHNDYPFCAVRQKLPEEAFNIVGLDKKRNNHEKLLLTLYDKKNYVIHFRMLKLAIKHGLKLKKVHKILKFKQSCYVKPYIDLNVDLRKRATNKFQMELTKFYMNSMFGKTMENLRERSNIKLITKWEGKSGARKCIAKPNFKSCKIFDENLVAIEFDQTHILMNKAIIIGLCVLEISKIVMYVFLYEKLKPKFGDKVKVAYTDTDSFILEIETDDFYEYIRTHSSQFDTSNFPDPNEYDIKLLHKKETPLMKDELGGEPMVALVGLRSKCYAVRKFSEIGLDETKKSLKIKRSKGIKKSVVQRKIKFSDYVDCLQKNCIFKEGQNTIRSIKHNVYSVSQTKVALNPADDKRYIIKPNRIETLAWGHYRINELERMDISSDN